MDEKNPLNKSSHFYVPALSGYFGKLRNVKC